jgi:hypothetical protein
MADEELHAELRLQPGDGGGNGGLGNVNRLGGAGDAARLGRGEEILDLPEREAHQPTPIDETRKDFASFFEKNQKQFGKLEYRARSIDDFSSKLAFPKTRTKRDQAETAGLSSIDPNGSPSSSARA